MKNHIKKFSACLALVTVLLGNCLTVDAALQCRVITVGPLLIRSTVHNFHTHTDRARGITYKCLTYNDYYEESTVCITCDKVLETRYFCKQDRHEAY